MVRGKKADKDLSLNLEQETNEKVKNIDVETDNDILDLEQKEESSSFKQLLNEFKEDTGWVHVRLKKDGKVYKIGRYRPSEFNKDEIAKEFGGGTYFYTLHDNGGIIRGRSEETYLDKKEQKSNDNNEMLQFATIIKEQTKEIETLKSDLLNSKTKSNNTENNFVFEMMKENQRQQIEILKAIATNHPTQQTSMTELLTVITSVVALFKNNQQPTQQKNNISELVELASLFADMKNNGELPKQETIVDLVKTFLTDGSLTNIIAMLKSKNPPLVQQPQQKQLQPVKQIDKQKEEVIDEKAVVQKFFRDYEKQLYQLKVNGGNAEYIAQTIIPFFELNNEFKVIGYNYFKDVNKAYEGLMEIATDFKNEQVLLKQIVELIHNSFNYEQEVEDEQN